MAGTKPPRGQASKHFNYDLPFGGQLTGGHTTYGKEKHGRCWDLRFTDGVEHPVKTIKAGGDK